MESHQVSRGTILEHLTKYALAGKPLHKQEDLSTLTKVTAEQKMAALSAFGEFGPILLKPVFEKLNGAVNYDELKVLRLLYLIEQNSKETTGPSWEGLS